MFLMKQGFSSLDGSDSFEERDFMFCGEKRATQEAPFFAYKTKIADEN